MKTAAYNNRKLSPNMGHINTNEYNEQEVLNDQTVVERIEKNGI